MLNRAEQNWPTDTGCYDLVDESEVRTIGTSQGYCPTCHAVTDYTHNSYGTVFCVSCGQTIDGEIVTES